MAYNHIPKLTILNRPFLGVKNIGVEPSGFHSGFVHEMTSFLHRLFSRFAVPSKANCYPFFMYCDTMGVKTERDLIR